MPRPKQDESLRHETFLDDEDSFVPRDTAIVPVAPKRQGKGKRSVEDMMASMPNAILQSAYALSRIAAAEDQIVKVLELCTDEGRELVMKQRPSLKRYWDK